MKQGLRPGLLLLLSLMMGCADRTTDQEHLANAKSSIEKGEWSTSIIELKNALQKNPDNTEARRLLGELNVKMGDGATAEKELRRAMELGVAKEALSLALAGALQLQGKNQEILDEIEPLPTLPKKDQSTLAAYRGDAWLALNKPDKARAEYEKALETDPTSPRGKLGMAYLAASDNDDAIALKLLDEALQVDPKQARLWSFKAELHRRRGELETAETAYGKAIDLRRRNETDRANRALVRTDLKKFEEAEKDIEILKKSAPKFYLGHFADGYFKIARKRFAEAQEALERTLQLNEHYPPTWFYLGLLYLHQNELQQADHYLSRFKTAFPNSVRAHVMLALVKYRLQDYREAKTLLMPVVLSLPDNIFALNLMANVEMTSGNYQEGLRYLQKIAELTSDAPSAIARLGTGLLAAGRKEEALKTLEAALAADASLVQADIFLARIHLEDKNFDKAHEAIDRLKAKMPDQPLPLNLEGLLYLAQGDDTRAKAVFEQALEMAPGDPTTTENLARLARRAGRYDEMRRLYQEVLRHHPDQPLAQLRLAQLDAREGKFKAMEERLNRLIQEQPQRLQPRLLLARHYLRFGQPQRSQTILEEIQPRYPEHPQLLALLVEAQLNSNQKRRALETAKRLANAAPDSAQALYLSAQAHAANGDLRNMRLSLERALAKDPEFLPARLTLVKLLTMEGQSTQAQESLAKLVQEYPDHPEVLNLQGWWALSQQRFQAAAEAFRASLAKQPRTETVMNLANALWLAQEPQQALKVLEEWNERYPRDAAVLYLRSEFYQRLGRTEDARLALRELLHASPNNPPALNNLAWLLRKEDPKQALDLAERAYDKTPESLAVLDTYAVILLENGQHKRARTLLERAVSQAPQNSVLRYHLALAQQADGYRHEAITSLREALRIKHSFPEREQAESLLQTLSSTPPQ